jgi:hypothetical protein
MKLCWNLICRAANAGDIRYNHMDWQGDALCIYFSHMKNDQTADRPRDPRHIYANPLVPEICPILSIALYWLCFDFDENNNKLFPGKDQYDRFRKILKRSTNLNEIATELEYRGMRDADIGTHSFRKGASTYCSSVTTAVPASAAVHLRAGWTLGGVQDTYHRYEGAGDMHVGRTDYPLQRHQWSLLNIVLVH